MNKKFVIKFSAQVSAVLSTFAHVRYNVYFHADFVEGEMIRHLNIDFELLLLLLLLLLCSVIVRYELCHNSTI
jgi:hypothetical protein